MIIFSFAYLFILDVQATIHILDKGVVPLEKHSIGIRFFINVENKDREETCKVHTWTKRCCFTDSEREECNIIHVYCTIAEVKARDRETLILVYPTLFQHDQMGFCDFVLDQSCEHNKKHKREYVNIPFDTRVPTSRHIPCVLKNYVLDKKREECSFLDEDSLNNCSPVNCDEKYSEARPFFDLNLSKCVKAATCIGNIKKQLPDIVLVPKSNVCRDLDKPLTMEDIVEISRGILVTTQPPNEGKELKMELYSNCSTISQNLYFLRDMVMGRFYPMLNVDTSEYNTCFKSAIRKIVACIVAVCLVLLTIIFCLNIIAWLHSKLKDGSLQSSWEDLKCKFRKKETREGCCRYKVSRVDANVKHSLLRQVIVRDIPMELRESAVDICDRMDRDVRWKKRYRRNDMGSQISLCHGDYSESSSTDSADNENARLVK